MLSASDLPTRLTLPNYSVIEILYRGHRTTVYQAVEKATQQLVAIKVLSQESPSFGELVQFRNQYTVTKDLPVSGIVRPIDFLPCGNSYALVMENFEGTDLGQYAQQQTLSLVEVLGIAIQLVDILHHLHQHRVIHKDIKPANILIQPESKRVKLIDFSIASLLPKETQVIQSAKNLEGSLAYLAPEQTGRMNRTIDYRTDFYSLGATLYQLLTGQLPFTSDDPLELIHCHIAKLPAPANQINPAVPTTVAAMVAKLMAKNAEDRYQTTLGLKCDLEKCLTQWKDRGAVAEFELGQRDLSDRFLIPEKLYGREAEVQILLEAFARVAEGAAELMLVAGYSGVGKTAVVNEIHKPIVQQRGYFIKGKFDQFNRNVPFSAFVSAFRDLVRQLLGESDRDLKIWRAHILEALGENAQVMIDLIPALENILGSQPPAPELSGSAAQNRFNLVFQKFIQVFATPDRPLVIFVDDLQWADSASLKLIQVLMAKGQSQNLLLLGAYRDNEVFPAHPLMLTLDELTKEQARIYTLALSPLSADSLNHLIADTLRVSLSVSQPLTKLVMQKTKGNPFFATQFLKALHQNRLITFDDEVGHWLCDLVKVQAAALTDDVVELMAQRLRQLPDNTQQMLKLAACIGAQFTLETLAIVSEQPQVQVARYLWQALQEGLILPQSDVYKFYLGKNTDGEHASEENVADSEAAEQSVANYRFLHDRVQQAAYLLIPDDQKQLAHLSIGRHLLDHISTEQLEAQLFDIVGQLNVGLPLVTAAEERSRLLQLNLRAGQKAIATTAYDTATCCLDIACKLLSDNCWDAQYELSVACYTAATEAAYLSGNLARMDAMFEVLQQNARELLDTAKVHEIKIEAYSNQGKLTEAIELGLTFLKAFDITFPEHPNNEDFAAELDKTQALLAGRTAEALLDLPEMRAPVPCALMQLLTRLSVPTYLSQPQLYPLIIFQKVQLSVTHGNSPVSSYGYACYGLLLGPVAGEIDAGFGFGQMALKLIESADNRAYTAKVLVVVYHFIYHWKKPFRLTLAPLKQAYTTGLESGDLAFAGFAAYIYGLHAYASGCYLPTVEEDIRAYGQSIARIQQQTALRYNNIVHQAVTNLIGSENPTQLAGPSFNETVDVGTIEQDQDHTGLLYFYINKLVLSYLFQDSEAAKNYAQQAHLYSGAGIGTICTPLLYFYEALAVISVLSQLDNPLGEQVAQNEQWQVVATAKVKLENWSKHAPANYQHRYDLVVAEENRVLGNRLLAIEAYDRAIASAKANEYIQEEALSNELAAQFYLDWGKQKIAASYLQEAYYGYSRWGAEAKVADLKKRYPKLLSPILQSPAVSQEVITALMTITAPPVDSLSHAQPSASSPHLNQAFDFATILKASQVLSSTIELEELLRQLTQIILQNSGGNRCVLILPNEQDEWQLRAISTPEETTLHHKAIDNNSTLPTKLIQYVKNTQEAVVVNGLKTELPILDDYLSGRQPKSLLCMPILNQGRCIGILSLENQETEGVFPEDRVLILNFLCTQAAISIENARLFDETQKVEVSLRESQEKLKKTADSIPGLIFQFRLDVQGQMSFSYLSERTDEILEIDRDQIIQNADMVVQCIAPECMPSFKTALKCSMENLTPFTWIGRFIVPSGRVKWLEILSTPAQQEDGSFLWDGVMLDVSVRKQAEAAVIQKSQDLENALAELKKTQLKMVQSEKMSALGGLVAGVAHEINNPVGCIIGNVGATQGYINDLLGLIDLYAKEVPNPSDELAEELEAIELDYVRQDLPKLIRAMKDSGDRIKSISRSLRTFSRADTEKKQPFNLHDGLDSTVLILRHRLKANEQRPTIEVVKEYSQLPEIDCFPGQLNQVFMNILANAIDALDDASQQLDFADMEAHPHRITIKTEIENHQLKVAIADNGPGIPETVKARIFDHLFTTKGVGKGTGLGLAIANQIIERTHGGTLEVNSELGQGTEFCIRLPYAETTESRH